MNREDFERMLDKTHEVMERAIAHTDAMQTKDQLRQTLLKRLAERNKMTVEQIEAALDGEGL
jgi:hypothetical protein